MRADLINGALGGVLFSLIFVSEYFSWLSWLPLAFLFHVSTGKGPLYALKISAVAGLFVAFSLLYGLLLYGKTIFFGGALYLAMGFVFWLTLSELLRLKREDFHFFKNKEWVTMGILDRPLLEGESIKENLVQPLLEGDFNGDNLLNISLARDIALLLLNALISAGLWTIGEYLRELGPFAFPTNLGLGFANIPYLVTFSSIFGIYGLSALMVFLATIFSCFFAGGQKREKGIDGGKGGIDKGLSGNRDKIGENGSFEEDASQKGTIFEKIGLSKNWFKSLKNITIIAIFALVLAVALGQWGLRMAKDKGQPFLVSTVQGSVPMWLYHIHKWDPERLSAIVDLYVGLSEKAAEDGARLIIWPETAIRFWLMQMPGILEVISQMARENSLYFIATSPHEDRPKEHNSAFLFDEYGLLAGRYDKRKLVPFAEDNYQAGESKQLFETALGKLGMAICFESTFPFLMAKTVKDGAEMLFVSTNDGGFKGTPIGLLHARNSIVRACENGRFLIRAGQTGLTFCADPNGFVKESLPPFTQGYLLATAQPREGLTLFTRIPWLFLMLCSLIVGFAILKKIGKKFG